jgi:hypothetical protein
MSGTDNLKILLYFSSHRQVKEIEYSSFFINKTKFIKDRSEVMIHCDNDSLQNEDIQPYIKYETKFHITRSKQTFPIYPNGVFNGFLKGLSNNFNFFQNYDYVIHLVPDCYITSEDKIKKLLIDNLDSEYNFIVDHHPYHNPYTRFQYACDFFIFKPKKIINIFSDHSDENVVVAENWLYSKIHEYNIPHKIICRGPESLLWNIDDYGLIHNHNLLRIKSIIDGNEDKNLRHC